MFIQSKRNQTYKRTAERGFTPLVQGKLAPIRREQAKVAQAIVARLAESQGFGNTGERVGTHHGS